MEVSSQEGLRSQLYNKALPSASLLLRFCYTSGKPVPQQSFLVSINQQPVQLHLNEEGYSQILFLKGSDWEGTLTINHTEMIDIKSGYPTHQQIIPLHPFKENNSALLITILPPPIIINLEQQCHLRAEQLRYFKENGNNALLFIHGYNLVLGQYGCYPEGFEIENSFAIIEPHFKNLDERMPIQQLKFKKSQYSRTICCDLSKPDELSSLFPDLRHHYNLFFKQYYEERNPEGLGKLNTIFNGTEACQWFVHMEYNFNRAAGVDRHYKSYTRILGVHWPGGVRPFHFKQAEQIADKTAIYLYHLIEQLIQNKIIINIVAHSLGCRLILKIMKMLVENNLEDSIEHIILWQAALPNNILSDHPNYKNAHQCSKKISVLHSLKDTVLQTLYSSAYVNQLSSKHALGYAGIKMDDDAIFLQNSGKLITVD